MRGLSKENTVAVIVTFNPEPTFKEVVAVYVRLFKQVVIVDNASTRNEPLLKEIESRFEQVCLCRSDKNRGIAWGLNEGIRKALSWSPEWIITFDQDSVPALNLLEVYNEVLSRYHDKEPIGLMCGGFNLRDKLASFPIRWESSLVLITSSMAHHVSVFRKVGLYNEALFIDSVDFEYVMRTRLTGFATLRILNDVIRHKIGAPLVRQIGPFRLESSNHNEIRRYYQGRNMVYLTRRFIGKFPRQIINFNYYFFCKVLPRMVLVERPLRPKLKALFRGFRDGLTFER